MSKAGEGVEDSTAPGGSDVRHTMVVCSLERLGPVQRRMQLMVDELMALDPSLEVLYVEPAVDVAHVLATGGVRSALAALRDHEVGRNGQGARGNPRLRVVRPRKWLPRVIDRGVDDRLAKQVLRATRRWSVDWPLLWINDAHYAPLLDRVQWPSIYDVTDDWLHASVTPRERRRLEAADRKLVDQCDAVVVCSPDLARTRGSNRSVEIIPNGVDVKLFQTPRARPADLPLGDVALYAGTLHEDRLDVDLCLELAEALPDVALVLLGPDSLSASSRARLVSRPNINLLGLRPYHEVPAYLQHADVVVVPHVVTPFTESLDPIKYYECMAVGRPTVATPVAGFRGAEWPIVVAERAAYVQAVIALLARADRCDSGDQPDMSDVSSDDIPTWKDRAQQFAAVMKTTTGWR